MTEHSRYWLTGPSGSGKTHLLHKVREDKSARGFDLDWVGFRAIGEDWKQWHIPTGIFSVLAKVAEGEDRPFIAAGCDSAPDAMWRAALAFGFEPVVVVPTVEQLIQWRKARGDAPEKIATSERDIASWTKHALKWGCRIIGDTSELM